VTSTQAARTGYIPTAATRAKKIFEVLAQKTDMSPEVLEAVGRSLYEDYLVQFLWSLWFDEDRDGTKGL
jgi:hypothetical protein